MIKCQACSINKPINEKSKHCEVCITEMVKNHTKMLLDGTMEERPYGYEVDIDGKPYIPIDPYVQKRFDEASKQMHESTWSAGLYEFYKGQFLAFREVLDAKYRKKQ